jgi:NADPH:quinone reductase-like Zn-dependent oxidoreductase
MASVVHASHSDEEITMKAIVQDRYGGPEALELAEIDRPPLGDRDALVRMHAASIHFGDQMIMRGKPKLFRPIYGFGKPRSRVPGLDIAGTVEAVGTGVTRFGPGEEVFGWGCPDLTDRADGSVRLPAR